MKKDETAKNRYTCQDYRAEMVLLGLQRRLQQEGLTEGERKELEREVEKLQKALGM